MVNVLIVDDSAIVRSLFETIISSKNSKYQITAQLSSAKSAVLYVKNNPVDLILMDVYTENRENGLAAAEIIKKEHPEIKIIIVTSLPEMSFIEKARDVAHCESFWYKEHGDISLLEVMDRTIEGESIYPDSSPVMEIGNAKIIEFTETELKVLRLLCEGMLNKDIAAELDITENTVKFHIKNMLAKAEYSNKYQLAIDAVEKKLVVPGF
ncbi:MAG: response regulator transcription factor [Lachnospiraceae bacterium]|nr:response regulator transcription factor [Lachnospiraceae bacterium]MBR1567705.1 response regulator transcription factor [Lachnospiraceae bacterium]